MSLYYRNISISLKAFLSLLLGILLLGEYLDGVNDISDWAVLFFFIIMANDSYIHFRLVNGQPLKRWILSSRSDYRDFKEKRLKYLMNLTFTMLMIGALILETSVVDITIRDTIYKCGVVIWSGVFLGVNIYNLKNSFNYKRLVFTNIAFIFLVGSVVLI
ncbi:MAG: hypothetical protein K9K67_01455 [Bacteriovoracaceae bacterium]|nr:hypothetical protein [Bacteriovoracaceae bacterium]